MIPARAPARSTKLLHGGVRYLELAFKQLDAAQLKLVREALSERQYWIDQAPFLAQPLRIALPTQGPIEQPITEWAWACTTSWRVPLAWSPVAA